MFAVIYRGYIYPNQEKKYIENWKIVANYFKKERGALGSSLHRASSGEFIAYSRWPDQKTRDLSWGDSDIVINEQVDKSIQIIKSCIDLSKPYDEITMEVLEDLISTRS